MEDDKLKRGSGILPKCGEKDCNNIALRVGAQDDCDVYKCPNGHITRVKICK